jgi:hypothetical protein
MDTETVNTLPEFITIIQEHSQQSNLLIFRGQPVQGNLLPSICRGEPEQDTTEIERDMIEEFQRMGNSLIPNSNQSKWDLLITAQHFGLKTRLLDWSSNPLIALWFACSGSSQEDSFVYLLPADEFQMNSKEGPFEIKQTRVFRPKLNNPRVIAQHGWFTAHRYSQKYKKFVALEKNQKIKNKILEITIPDGQKINLRKALDRFGINSHVLFPDLEGLCKHINWKNNYEP